MIKPGPHSDKGRGGANAILRGLPGRSGRGPGHGPERCRVPLLRRRRSATFAVPKCQAGANAGRTRDRNVESRVMVIPGAPRLSPGLGAGAEIYGTRRHVVDPEGYGTSVATARRVRAATRLGSTSHPICCWSRVKAGYGGRTQVVLGLDVAPRFSRARVSYVFRSPAARKGQRGPVAVSRMVGQLPHRLHRGRTGRERLEGGNAHRRLEKSALVRRRPVRLTNPTRLRGRTSGRIVRKFHPGEAQPIGT